jgi:hypothetical protein
MIPVRHQHNLHIKRYAILIGAADLEVSGSIPGAGRFSE